MYLVGNWKMEGSRAFAAAHLREVARQMQVLHVAEYHTIIHCPPFPWLCEATVATAGSALKIGAQDCSHHTDHGAYTGEVSARMLREVGCEYVILGHSERRAQHQENDAMIAKKLHAALAAKLIPIVCVGESAAQRATGSYLPILHRQLGAILAFYTGKLHSLIVAYEPIWAIGSGHTPTTSDIQEVSESLHHHLESHGVGAPSMLYGGSVRSENAAEILAIPSINGVLVGGASIDAEQWTGIMKAATSHNKE
jgi:triosephosphate isomerase (TIM)